MDLTSRFLCNVVLYSFQLFFHHQSHPQLGIVFALTQPLLSVAISPFFSSSILGTYQPGEFIFQCHLFAFYYCSWGSQGKNTEVVCHSLLQWTTSCQQRHYYGDKSLSSQSCGFSSSHVWMWELDYKESWMQKNWCNQIDESQRNASELWCREDSWESLIARRSNQSILKEISPEYSLEGLTLKLKLQYLWPPDVRNRLIWKDTDAGKDWRQEEKVMTEDEMVGWHHQLNGHEFEQALGIGDGQGSLACCSPWGSQIVRHDKRLNWTESIKEEKNI